MRFIGTITDDSTLGKDWCTYHDPSDLRSLILIRIIPKERTLSKWVKISNKKIDMLTSTTIKWGSCLSHKACYSISVESNVVFRLISFILGCLVLTYNPGQNLLRQIVKMPFFSCHPGKNWNHHQMNARFPTSPYPKLFRIAWQLYVGFRPRQLWIGFGEGAYFFCLEETVVGLKS